ncbi:DegT/DnrJ/EryC1/StrS family aminotransferase [Patescibacteria group bacterium]|nr:DegT/DnrJ/EryC1/StrS family aminotransferase [Patescibacteria group bacterium]MBU4274290.1 DegT/DnrJ/EryC1/StrS family aminotransferase [Patescibacteria group bacterium]MBU4367841.1 DegT/DnrJ/EryC1/StrS family aminotransferase [Patescibacteria group bacterium]MBU4462029.1 DegT/DnrJ/EryC1/StrS family aminotransferase [Patescibacteria group bacterium]MCG2700263.1 DegT/DnrJ/EryC1/StrS family aminotransferase [Candidatus Parcubacteria bacterium]
MKVEFIELKRQHQLIKKEINTAIQNVLDSGNFILGEEVKRFEEELAGYCGVKYAVGVASGSDALFLSLKALDVKGEVITTPFSFFATAGAIFRAGARPVFVDIGEDYNINPDKIERAITKKTEAIIPVHLYGMPCNMQKIMEIAKKHNLKVIEDAAQALGTEFNGKKMGSFGDTGCLSFFPTKNLGCFGDGGAILTNNDGLAEKIRTLRVHGAKPKYFHKIIGINSRLDALQAAVLRVKLCFLEKWNKQRKEAAEFYNSSLRNLKNISCPVYVDGRTYNLYTIRTKNRDELKEYLTKNEIGSEIYYPLPLHLQECYSFLGYKKGDFPEAEKACQEVLSIPLFPGITKEEQEYVVSKIKEFV